MNKNTFKNNNQSGFTLIELVIVVVILGILAIVVARAFGAGVSDSAKAQALYSTAQNVREKWGVMTVTTGISPVLNGNPILNTPATGLVGGSNLLQGLTGAAITTNFTLAMQQNTIVSMSDIIDPTNAVMGIPIALTDGNPAGRQLKFIYGNATTPVPSSVAVNIVKKYNSASGCIQAGTNALTATCASGSIQWTTLTASGAVQDLTILLDM